MKKTTAMVIALFVLALGVLSCNLKESIDSTTDTTTTTIILITTNVSLTATSNSLGISTNGLNYLEGTNYSVITNIQEDFEEILISNFTVESTPIYSTTNTNSVATISTATTNFVCLVHVYTDNEIIVQYTSITTSFTPGLLTNQYSQSVTGQTSFSKIITNVYTLSHSFIYNTTNIFTNIAPDYTENLSPYMVEVQNSTTNYDFYISAWESTFIEYDAYCTAKGLINNEIFNTTHIYNRYNLPVQNISPIEFALFCNWLSEENGLKPAFDTNASGEVIINYFLSTTGTPTSNVAEVEGFRMATFNEWQYAAKGGDLSAGYTYSGSDVINDVSWNYTIEPVCFHPVGQLQANELGLYDMSGNEWELCFKDFSSGLIRMGGSAMNEDESKHEPDSISCDTADWGESCPGQGWRMVRTKF